MQIKAFRLNKYEDCGKVLKYIDAFELYRVNVLTVGKLIKNFIVTTVKDLHSYRRVLMKKQPDLCFTF